MARSQAIVPTLLGGVSQQAHAVRRGNLVDSATNVEFLANEGAIKRYPSDHIASLGGDLTGYRVFPLERDDESYHVCIGDGDVQVFTEDGTACTVTDNTTAFGYLSGATQRDLRVQRIADSMYVLNRGVTTAGAAGRGFAAWEDVGEAGLFIRATNYSVTYTLRYKDASGPTESTYEYVVPGPISVPTDDFTVNISAAQASGASPITWLGFPFNSIEELSFRNGSTSTDLPSGDFTVVDKPIYGVTYTGSGGISSGDILEITRQATTLDWYLDTTWVLENLLDDLTADQPNISVLRNDEDPVASISNDTNAIEIFEISDTESNDLGTAWIRTVDEITDLPTVFRHGAVVEISGSTADLRDNYWVTFAGDDWVNETDSDPAQFDDFDNFGSGSWIETQERGLATGNLDADTMPHILRRTGSTTFTWDAVEWDERPSGDNDTNKEPSFIGFPIQAIFFHEGRLGTLANNSLVMSESAELTNFWRSTVRSVPPSDRIDVELSDLDGDVLYHAIQFDSQLLIFSRQRQARVFGQPALAPDTIQAPLLSSYRVFPDVPPVNIGQSLFFGYPTTQFAQIREFIPSSESNRVFDQTITLAAPKYIPADVRRMASGTVGETIAVLTDTDTSKLFVYTFLRLGGNLAQAAWQDWDFTDPIIDFSFLDDRLVLLIDRGGTTFLEEVKLGAGRTETDEEFVPRLDRQATVLSGTYDASEGWTNLTAPYAPSANVKVLEGTSANTAYGVELDVAEVSGTTIRVTGDVTGQGFVIGEPYTASIELTRPYFKVSVGGGEVAVPRSRQTVNALTLMLDDTGYLKATCGYVSSDDAVEEFLGELLGADVIDSEVVRTGELHIPIYAGVEDFRVTLSSDSALPFNIISGAWDIRYRPQRLLS